MTFRVHTPETAPAGAGDALIRIVQRYGFVPNLAGVFAESPASLNGLLGLMAAYDAPELTLSPVERQLVLLAVSVFNRCAYCTAAHSLLADMAGLDRIDIGRVQDGNPIDDARLEALRRFTETVVERRGWVADGDVARFLTAGFTQAQVLEVIFGVALKTLTNYANHLTRPPVNDRFAAYMPSWAEAA